MTHPSASLANREFYHLIMRLSRALTRALEDVVADEGITVAEFNMLLVLGEGEPQSSAELGRRAFMTPQASHQLVRGLLARGLVESVPHPTNGRERVVSLTDPGWEIAQRTRAALHDIQDRLAQDLSREERAAFESVLSAMAESIHGGWFGDLEAEARAAQRRAARGRGAAKNAGEGEG